MAFILTKASDIRIATVGHLGMAAKTPEWERPGSVEQGQHDKQRRKKTNRRPLNTICHLIGGKALKLVSLPANSGPPIGGPTKLTFSQISF